MYAPHMGATAVRTEFAATPVRYDRNGKPASLWALNGSASLAGRQLTVTVVNPHAEQALEAAITVHGASIEAGSGLVLTNADLHAHNDFEHPDVVRPAPASVTVAGGRAVHQFPAASVTALYLTLA
jgi:alpha-N-arabinofuranosidase